VHLNDLHSITFGELAGGLSERVNAIGETMKGAGFDATVSDNILQQMWGKWVFLATLAASTCLFRASVGDILATPDGGRVIAGLLTECRAVSAHNGYPMGEDFVARARHAVRRRFADDGIDAARRREPFTHGSRSHSRRPDQARRRRAA
jgi:2-dehydropantoate 2-reductase